MDLQFCFQSTLVYYHNLVLLSPLFLVCSLSNWHVCVCSALEEETLLSLLFTQQSSPCNFKVCGVTPALAVSNKLHPYYLQ